MSDAIWVAIIGMIGGIVSIVIKATVEQDKKPAKKKGGGIPMTIILWAVVISLAVFIVSYFVYTMVIVPNKQAAIHNAFTFTVTDKTVVSPGGKSGSYYFYMIYGYDDYGVYRTLMVDDWKGRDNSSDWYGALEVGETYHVRTIGERIPALSEYPNIVGVDEFTIDGYGEISR